MSVTLIQDGCYRYLPQFLSADESRSLMKTLMTDIAWRQDEISVFGKSQLIPRLQAWYGDSGSNYSYSGLSLNPLPWIEPLSQLKLRCERAAATSFNSVLCNLYRTGQDTVGWHSDDEIELGQNPVIASLSLGAPRDFYLQHKQTKEKIALKLLPGSLLIMSGTTQHFWRHSLPRSKKVQQPRINLTFRRVKINS